MAFLSFITRRLLQLIPTLAFILVVIFVLVRLLPGDPASAILGDRARDADVARINAELGLDKPLPVQFLVFIKNIATGDLGNSIHLKVSVASLIAERLPVTLMLTAMAALIAVVLAVPLAFVAATRRGRIADSAIRGSFQVGLSMPVFYVGLILLTVFGAQLHWFPVGGYRRHVRRPALPPVPAGRDARAQPLRDADAQLARRDHRRRRCRICRLRPRQGALARGSS